VVLGTQTSGNYVTGNTAGTGIAITGTPGAGWSPTIALSYADTLATNSLGVNQTVFGSTGVIFEGSTADGFETLLTVTNPTADRTITLPNAGGTVAVSASGNIALSAAGNITFTGILPGANGGTNNGFMAFTGPTTTLKTFTLPNVDATILTSNAAVTVPQGGTGLTTLTANGVLYGNGTGNVGVTAAGTTGQCLVATTGLAPSWSSCIAGAGDILQGGNSFATTMTIGTNDVQSLVLETQQHPTTDHYQCWCRYFLWFTDG
jgi:hypothetical protein